MQLIATPQSRSRSEESLVKVANQICCHLTIGGVEISVERDLATARPALTVSGRSGLEQQVAKPRFRL